MSKSDLEYMTACPATRKRERPPRQRRARRVTPEIAGTVRMNTDECRKHLGHGAFLLWQKLLHCRNREGVTHVTYPTLADFRVKNREGHWVDFEHQSPRQIERAFGRLKRAGVVHNVRWFKTCSTAKPVMRRVVLGCWSVGRKHGWSPTFPGEVWRGVRSLSTRGGARPGAGRPRTSSDFKTGDIGAPNSSGGDNRTSNSVESGRPDSFPSERNSGAVAPRFDSVEEDGRLATTSNGGGAGGSGGRGSPRGVPTYPGSNLIKTATVPHPPQLDPDAKPVEWAERLAQAYRGVAEARTGKRCWVFARGDITRSKHYNRFVAAARALIEHEIPPAAWASFSFDVWRDHAKRNVDKPPPVTWVFAENRIHKNRGWFRSAGAGAGMGGRVVLGEKHRALLTRYGQMKWELRLTPDEEVAEVVERFFPGDTYDRMVEDSLREVEDIQASLRSRAASGQYLWG